MFSISQCGYNRNDSLMPREGAGPQMPSTSLQDWSSVRAVRLDEIEAAHRSVGGTGPGRRYATQQINQAYAVLLSSQFQGFCRDLHTESVNCLVRAVLPATLRVSLQLEYLAYRKLDRGNPSPGNIGADFNRLGLTFWSEVQADDGRNPQRRALLEELNEWRNAIAHQDFDPARLGGSTILRLERVRSWRNACDGLARSFERVLFAHLNWLTGAPPW
jgi:hypothetical protein